jgi:AcrR family transcriptional regulator
MAAASGGKRPRGRPPRLTPAAIVEAAMALLAAHPPEEISLALVARSLAAPTMSLYHYFPNQTVLLEAVADHAFSLFRFPEAQLRKPWPQALLAWLWAVQRHCVRHPVSFKIMSVEGQASPAWMKVQRPLLKIFQRAGLSGRPLTFAMSCFHSQAMGLIVAESWAAPARAIHRPRGPLEGLDAAEQQAQRDLDAHLAKIRRDEVLAFGFRAIVHSLEALVPRRRSA